MPQPQVDTPAGLADLPATFTYADARAIGLSKHALYRLRDNGLIDNIARGLFRRADTDPADLSLIAIAAISPRATLCLATALARHGLSDAIPAATDIALPRGARPPAVRTAVAWHHFAPQTFDLGRDTLHLDPVTRIGIYNAERSIIDAFRTRGTEGHELANEALRRWLRRPGSQPAQLLRLAAHWPRTLNPIRKALQVLL